MSATKHHETRSRPGAACLSNPQSRIRNPQSLRPRRDALRARVNPRGLKPAAPYGRGFSLIELMIAIVILGLGMVMVATMFPVAWSRARTLAEFTSEQAVADTADATVKMLCRVDGSRTDAGSFAGDLILSLTGGPVSRGDPRVHALHLENIPAVSPQQFVWEQPYRREFVDPQLATGWADPPADVGDLPPSYYNKLFLWPQVRFESRVYPPLPPRQNVGQAFDTTYGYQEFRVFTDEDPGWDELLDTRRYAWAVFHRLHEDLASVALNTGPAAALASTRTFDMYYVTLRRPNPNNRYAQQADDVAAPGSLPDPNSLGAPPVVPAALPAAYDVMFPVPWRVQVWVAGPLVDTVAGETKTGVPTEIQVPAPTFSGTPTKQAMLIDMFPTGAWFIDEQNGTVYRVVKSRVAASGQQAFLTLDQELTVQDMDIEGGSPNLLEPAEQLRTVWVFPPPAEATRVGGDPVAGDPVFKRSQPVVSIDVRTVKIAPSD